MAKAGHIDIGAKGTRVVHGMKFKLDPQRLTLPDQAWLLQEWRRAMNGGIPPRAEFTPLRLARIATRIVIFEVIGNAPTVDYRVRYLGLEIENVFGKLTGKLQSEFGTAPWTLRSKAICDLVTEFACPVAGIAPGLLLEGKTWLQNHVLYLPMSEDGAGVSYILAIMQLAPRKSG